MNATIQAARTARQRPRKASSPSITGLATALAVIEPARERLGLTDHALEMRAGVASGTLRELRTRQSDVRLSTVAALLNETGYDLAALPTVAGARLDTSVLRLKLTDLATSIANQRHYDDLKSEIDDILFELDR